MRGKLLKGMKRRLWSRIGLEGGVGVLECGELVGSLDRVSMVVCL